MTAEDDARPQPDALLSEVAREARGKLKIFLGAAPGVGKTYAMLQAGHERRREGVDIVAAVIETHGRADTERLLRGLEIVPRQNIPYRGRVFSEMDLDATLRRRPALALVDELAHTNVSGARHVKRWQDVEELLGAGIDVYSTLNIQHLESLTDIVERIAKVQVRETLPDSVLELADEIELIDLPPEALIQRLREGKVYVPEQARRAIHHFFSRGNLTALRELAMRTAAERVDKEMLDYMRAHAVPGPWPTRDRLLVCVDGGPSGGGLVRTARRMADRARIPWIAVHIEAPGDDRLGDGEKSQLDQTLRLAERLGAEVVTLPGGPSTAKELLRYARSRNVTRIVIGRDRGGLLRRLTRSAVTSGVLAGGADFEVTVVTASDNAIRRPRLRTLDQRRELPIKPYAWSVVAVAVATGIAAAIEEVLPLPNLSLVFLSAVLAIAVRFGTMPALVTSALSLALYNFFFTVPYLTFSVYHQADILTLVFFILVAVLTGNLAGRLRAQLEAVRQTARRNATLYDFSRKVAGAAGLDDVLWAVCHHVSATLGGHSLVLLPTEDDGDIAIAAGYPPEDKMSETDWAAARWAWSNDRPAGWATETLAGAQHLFMPLKTGRGTIGLIGISFPDGERLLAPEQERLLQAVADQSAVAIERAQLVTDLEDARVQSEAESLRTALLSSISHDLRTPLVSIIGSATTLEAVGDVISPEDRKDLVGTVLEEAHRLNRFVQNLLDMTRLGYGALQPRRDWTDLREVLGRSVYRLRDFLAPYRVKVNVDEGLPLLYVDPVLMEQVLVNILDNAAKYSPEAGLIDVTARLKETQIEIAITDDGPGIPPHERDLVFDMFYRARAGDARPPGTGLGLAICKGLVEAHGGTIRADEGPGGRGTRIQILLPTDQQPRAEQPDDEDIEQGGTE
jgi:two-component system sensor histidine kinase KdpD